MLLLLDLFTRSKYSSKPCVAETGCPCAMPCLGRGGVTVPLVLKCVEVVQVCSNSDVLLLVNSNAEDLSFDHHRRVCVGKDLKDHFIPTPCSGQGHLPPAQVL